MGPTLILNLNQYGVKGENHPFIQESIMNTLTLVKKQIQKAAALHDAPIANTAYRGVVYESKQGAEDIAVPV